MDKKRNFLQKYKWTIGTTLVWALLIGIGFHFEKEESPQNLFLIALIAFVVYQALFGIRLDKKAQKDYIARQETQKKEKEELGEATWLALQEKRKKEKESLNREGRRALLINLFCGALYLAAARLVFGGGAKWIKREIPGLLWFLIFFHVTAYWIAAFPRRRRENVVKLAELLLMLPFSLAPFGPLFRMLPVKFAAVYIFAALSWELTVFALLFWNQAKERQGSCTVQTTATVVDNKKSILRSFQRPDATSVPTYQPVLDYYANGEWFHITCDDGQPRPLQPGLVVKIYYNPANPREFRFGENQKTFTDKYCVPILLGVSVLLLIAAIGIGYFS